jgi:hypothetical protein
MTRLAFAAAVALSLPAWALAQRAPLPPSREELGAGFADLQRKLDALRADLGNRDAATQARLAALQQALDALKESSASASAAQAAKVEELAAALDELKDDAARKGDLARYVRKPDEKEFKSRSSQELELRTDWIDLRQDEIAATLAGIDALAKATPLQPAAQAIVHAADQVGHLLELNDQQPRPRMLFRLYWETNRFIDEKSFLTVYAEPELQLFVYDSDIDRYLIPRDVAAPYARLGLVFKKAAASVTLGPVAATAGVLQFTYGAGFFVNPTNPFTPKNPLDPRREVYGIPAAKLDLALVQDEALTLTAQIAGVASRVRNDLLGLYPDRLAAGGLAMLKADTKPISLTAIGIYQSPNEYGLDSPSFGGIVSTTPFGITASVEALWTEAPYGGDYEPELVASLQGFTSAIGANGTTYVLEFYANQHMPTTAVEDGADLARAVERGQQLIVADWLTRPLHRRNYFDLYLEPSLTQKLRVNVGGILGFDEAVGGLVRAGFDYDFYNFSVHAYGGATVGEDQSEFNHHPFGAFADLAVFASF